MADDTSRPEASASARVLVQRPRLTLEMMALALALFAQSGAIVWWASKTDARITAVEQTVRPLGDGSLLSAIARIDERTTTIKEQVVGRMPPPAR